MLGSKRYINNYEGLQRGIYYSGYLLARGWMIIGCVDGGCNIKGYLSLKGTDWDRIVQNSRFYLQKQQITPSILTFCTILHMHARATMSCNLCTVCRRILKAISNIIQALQRASSPVACHPRFWASEPLHKPELFTLKALDPQ